MPTLTPRERARKTALSQTILMYSFSLSAVAMLLGIVGEYAGGRSPVKLVLYALAVGGFVSLARHARKEARSASAEAEEREPL